VVRLDPRYRLPESAGRRRLTKAIHNGVTRHELQQDSRRSPNGADRRAEKQITNLALQAGLCDWLPRATCSSWPGTRSVPRNRGRRYVCSQHPFDSTRFSVVGGVQIR
jgi:hypothetical protein